MQKPDLIWKLLKNLWVELTPIRRLQFFGIFTLMIFSALAEMANIGSILTFLTALISPEKFLSDKHLIPVFGYLEINDPNELMLFVAIIFAGIVAITNFLRLSVVWLSTRVMLGAGADLSLKAYRYIHHQSYEIHISRNSSQVLNSINKVEDVISAINLVLNLFSCFILIIAIFIAIMVVNPLVAVSSTLGFGLIYLIIIYVTKNKLFLNSRRVADNSTIVIKSLQEGMGGIRDILIDSSQEVFCSAYEIASKSLRRSQGNIEIIKAAPRYFVETLGMFLILLISYLITLKINNRDEIIPTLGALALASQRLLPLLQSAYTSFTGIRGINASLVDALHILKQPKIIQNMNLSNAHIEFNKNIELINLEFKYNLNDPTILKNINLNIKKGEKIGVIGKTGGGKSTLMDVMMCLLEPTAGSIKIDGVELTNENLKEWKSHISHVPQYIYLSDNSIRQNIAFGVPAELIDDVRVRDSAEKAMIDRTIDSWPKKFETNVGERGVKLSGGQRQRIGIARAIYKNADVIFFDEATSALDNETETSVMEAIENLSNETTVFIVAHRLTTLKGCTRIIEIESGSISRIISYEEIMKEQIRN
jgi:ATP-binding cassette subfamily B protein